MLGHAKASMTLDTYANLFDEDLDELAGRLDAAIRAAADGFGSLTLEHVADLLKLCGAKGIRTPDLLDANESRYQLRHSP